MPPPAMPPPLSRLEQLFLDSGSYDFHQGSLDAQCNRIREWLRSEIDQRPRDATKEGSYLGNEMAARHLRRTALIPG